MVKIPLNAAAAQSHCKLLQPYLEKRIRAILKNGIIKNKARIYARGKVKSYLKSLPGLTLEQLLTSQPSKFPTIIRTLETTLPGITDPGSNTNIIFLNLFISSVYESKDFNKLDFIRTIGTDTCPYCNRNYIYALDKKNKIKPPIDHFYPKSIYPFLGLSFYNLIPSCSTCNGPDAKYEEDPRKTSLQNPYLITDKDFEFSYRINKAIVLGGVIDGSAIDVLFINSLKSHMTIFKLQELYNLHSDHVAELIVKCKVKYPASYKTDLKNLGLKSEEIDRMILGNYSLQKDVHKRPLAKLYQDIGRELRLIK